MSGSTPPLLSTGSPDDPVLLFGHGAGAPMDSPWMSDMAARIADGGVRVVRFEFGYMAARRTGTRKPPPRAESLVPEYLETLDRLGGTRVVVGGKSLGGRVASMAALEEGAVGRVIGLACVGYPFHPPGRPERLRTAHLHELAVPALFCQGTRDPFGSREEVEGYGLPASIRLEWFEDGEHELKPRVRQSGFTHEQHLAAAARALSRFVRRVHAEAAG